MIVIRVPLLKALTDRVKAHVRGGKLVRAHIRVAREIKGSQKSSTTLRANIRQMAKINETIESNMGYLIHMGREIARVHGLSTDLVAGRPSGDLADLISEGKHGMLIGGMESIKDKKTGDARLMTMKNRAKQRMRAIAKKFTSDVTLPASVFKHLAIIATATEKYMKANSGEKPSADTLADMVTLHIRNRAGESVEMGLDQKIARIEALEGYKGAQIKEELTIDPHIGEADVPFWTKWTVEERNLRDETHKIINELVSEGSLSKEEQEVLFLRFYVDKPDYRGADTRSFSTIAKTFDKQRGQKHVKVLKQIGDSHRFLPSRKIRVVEQIKTPRKKKVTGVPEFFLKRKVSYRYEKYKTPVTGEIISVGPDSFDVRRKGKKQVFTIEGKPPFKANVVTSQMQMFRLYQSGVEKILSHHSASKKLRSALAGMQKSIKMMVPSRIK